MLFSIEFLRVLIFGGHSIPIWLYHSHHADQPFHRSGEFCLYVMDLKTHKIIFYIQIWTFFLECNLVVAVYSQNWNPFHISDISLGPAFLSSLQACLWTAFDCMIVLKVQKSDNRNVEDLLSFLNLSSSSTGGPFRPLIPKIFKTSRSEIPKFLLSRFCSSWGISTFSI